MQQDIGNFINTAEMNKRDAEKVAIETRNALIRLNPQYDPGKHQDPNLAVGEIIEIKMVKFRVIRIKADGKVGLKMLNAAEILG